MHAILRQSLEGQMDALRVRRAEPADAAWIGCFLREHWRATTMAVHGELIDAAVLPALIAGNRQGLATWRRLGADAELVSINAVPAGAGVGTALIEALAARLRAEGCARLWLTMMNANLSGLRFYQRRGFRLLLVRPGAVDEARRLKPSIPMVGEYGIPMHDELDLCRVLDPGREQPVPLLPPWSRTAEAAAVRGNV
jgi:GNAT superfamily N-acetyltransferase